MKVLTRYIYIIILTCLPLISCSIDDSSGKNTLARVGNAILTKETLNRQMPYGLSETDSIKFARAYIRNWIDTKLISEIAYNNISDTKEIEHMVDEYRNELIMWKYRKLMYNQRTTAEFSDDSIAAYYETHKKDFTCSHPYVKGIYIKIKDNAPQISNLRKWYRSPNTEDIDKIEKYGLNGAIHYDYFRDKWIDWEQIASKIPYKFGNDPDVFLRKTRFLDTSIDGFTYLLDISDYIPSGSTMPIDVARPQIEEMLMNEKRLQYDMELRQQLYQDAVNNNKVEIFCDMGI